MVCSFSLHCWLLSAIVQVYIRCFNHQVYSMMGFPGGSDVKNLLAMQETLVQFLSWEDLLEKG